jgi:hypothetical protein
MADRAIEKDSLMPALPAHLQVTMNFRRKDHRCSCILYYLTAPAMDAGGMVEALDTVQTALADVFKAGMNQQTWVDPCWGRYVGGSNEFEGQSSANSVQGTVVNSGSVINDAMPEENAVVIQRRTDLIGRSKRGRIFVPFIPELFAMDSELTTAALDAYKAVGSQVARIFTLPSSGRTLTPVQPDFKNGLLHQVLRCRVLSEICSRRDRRDPKRPVYYLAPSPP